MIKRQFVLFALAAALVAAAPGARAQDAVVASKTPKEPVWEAHLPSFNEPDYDRAVEALISSFERANHYRLVPGPKKKVGLKVYTDSGPGMATPIPLVKAVIAALERRGFEHKNIFLVGLNQLRLRMTRYLPSLVTGQTPFGDTPIFVLESNRFYDPVWFYDSPLPERFDPIMAAQQTKDFTNSSSK